MNPCLQYSNPEDAAILNTVCAPVDKSEFDIEDFETYYKNMIKICEDNNGVWLAANQIGITKRFFVIHTENLSNMFINPVIESYSWQKLSSEWCLSFADGKKTIKPRYKTISVSYMNPFGATIEWLTLTWREAIIFQHELDHLNWITI